MSFIFLNKLAKNLSSEEPQEPKTLDLFLNNLISKSHEGEGSRGGIVVGHTKTGDPIYDSQKKRILGRLKSSAGWSAQKVYNLDSESLHGESSHSENCAHCGKSIKNIVAIDHGDYGEHLVGEDCADSLLEGTAKTGLDLQKESLRLVERDIDQKVKEHFQGDLEPMKNVVERLDRDITRANESKDPSRIRQAEGKKAKLEQVVKLKAKLSEDFPNDLGSQKKAVKIAARSSTKKNRESSEDDDESTTLYEFLDDAIAEVKKTAKSPEQKRAARDKKLKNQEMPEDVKAHLFQATEADSDPSKKLPWSKEDEKEFNDLLDKRDTNNALAVTHKHAGYAGLKGKDPARLTELDYKKREHREALIAKKELNEAFPGNEEAQIRALTISSYLKSKSRHKKDDSFKYRHSFLDQAIAEVKEESGIKKSIDVAIDNLLLKAGRSGEGSRGGRIVGHTKSGDPIYESSQNQASQGADKKETPEPKPAKPFPGEEQHNSPKTEPKPESTYIPAGGLAPHYSDEPEMKAYKNLISLFKKEGLDFQGHLTYNPKTKNIETLTPQAEKVFQDLKTKYLKGDSKAKPEVK